MTRSKIKTAIVGIDIQNDFTRPNGALYVKGAEDDVRRMSKFIEEFGYNLDYLVLSMDSHQPIHISSQCYWKDNEGYPPALFDTVTSHDVESGKWTPQHNKDTALTYLKQIEQAGEVCRMWPPHCIEGGWGWAINEEIIRLLFSWCIGEGKSYELLMKGRNQATEHYSIFRAAVEIPEDKGTCLNKKILNKLGMFDTIIVMGEAADYCVASSMNDILEFAPHLAPKIIMATDCMSWIDPENSRAKTIFERAEAQGVRFMTSDEIMTLY